VPGACALVWVEGPDAASFLHGLLSNDIEGLAVGAVRCCLLLDGKGRIQADVRVARDGATAFTLVTWPHLGQVLADALEHFHVSEDLDVLGPEPSDLVTVGGIQPEGIQPEGIQPEGASIPPDAAGVDLVLPGLVPGTLDLVVPDAAGAIDALGLPHAPGEALEARRIEAGVPRVGIDTGPSTLVQEAGLEDVAVSFDKGCYLGQETVARVAYRGHVNRRLRGLCLPASASPGSTVSAGGRNMGRVTSVAKSPERGWVALAMIRTSVATGACVEVDGVAGAGRVVTLPFP